MPRLPTSLLRKAYAIDSLLPPLLGPCRDLNSARNELRWLREHVDKVSRARYTKGGSSAKGGLLRTLVRKRVSGGKPIGAPLQYGLGTEYFGDLEIEVRPGVLIPRPETAASVTHLTRLVRDARELPTELRILDLCTGTGCIPLLFHDVFYSVRSDVELRFLGVDISSKAIALANRNLQRLRRSKKYVHKGVTEFMLADVLVNPFADRARRPDEPLPLKSALNFNKKRVFWDILVSNPPYISPSAFRTTTARSVRGFEPRLALVPPGEAGRSDTEQGDAFYPMLLVAAIDAEVKIVLLEVADLDQAYRVARMAQGMQVYDGIEIWRDQPDQAHDGSSQPSSEFPIIGQGNGRSVLCWRGPGALWLGKNNGEASNAGPLVQKPYSELDSVSKPEAVHSSLHPESFMQMQGGRRNV
ncbi:hypothetical protein K505DRAFT_258947 [Melanomma pulvis-pyrius CBS 109.77]|uniref:S-adenosyl-L-methionine-dependent methyltransferase n=1 Tax=Melanomma pulvis-pyrius CBS 109.77 TaxID=1314802 RepID=A0A6A6WSI0_9PLEO|nr:hypothetical protein K505DRAFT_258947 [Melanomma pulvis-pyrius CBS 109.77]